jgi:integrase
MNQQEPSLQTRTSQALLAWRWPIHLSDYDRRATLSEEEHVELDRRFVTTHPPLRKETWGVLQRLLQPLYDVLVHIDEPRPIRSDVIRVMAIEMHRRGTSFWAWTSEEWRDIFGPDRASFAQRYGWHRTSHSAGAPRQLLPFLAYLFCPSFSIDSLLKASQMLPLAHRVFGTRLIEEAVQRLSAILRSWGYQLHERQSYAKLRMTVVYLLLCNRSPYLEDLSIELLETAYISCTTPLVRGQMLQVSHALSALGIIAKPLSRGKGARRLEKGVKNESISDEWVTWCERWRKQTTREDTNTVYYQTLKVGRWLKATCPDITSPAQWTYELAAEFVAEALEMKVGEWVSADHLSRTPRSRIGQPLRPSAKALLLGGIRTFFRDCQEWNWIPIHFNPLRAFRLPASIRNAIGPKPRVVKRELWAKILWAAMNLEEKDLPIDATESTFYPIEMVRAIAVVWCFAALRSDEIQRLRVSCVRWQYEDVMIPETGTILPKDATCFLDIPVNKTSSEYTKPVHPLVGERINEWERIRPKEQLQEVDKKTGEPVQFLFSFRGRRVSRRYINRSLIPLLCNKSGLPLEDSRGKITSHRARATIASMLYNAKEPLDVFQIQKYLGHKHLSSTQSYLQVDPTKLASQVAKAGYLEQNLATVEVLLDQDAVRSGAAARGETWKYYDLGHGWCTNDFWAECKHRMACARCPFYRPKNSTMDHLIEGKANLVRMLEFVQLTEEEKVLVTEGIEVHQHLIEQLANVPTPAGPTPRELETQRRGETKVIPIQTIRRNMRKQREEP